MLYGSDERFSGSECLAFEARLNARRKSVRRDNVARFSRPLGALRGPMPHTFVLRSIFHREPAQRFVRRGDRAPLASFLPASVLLPPTSRVHGTTHAVDLQGPGEAFPRPTRPGGDLPTRSLHGYATIPDWAYSKLYPDEYELNKKNLVRYLARQRHMEPIIIERWLTFTLIDGKWDIQLWADNAKPVNAKVYRFKVAVPAELIGEVAAEVT